MERMAVDLATALSAHADVTVFGPPGSVVDRPPFTLKRVLSGAVDEDLTVLAGEDVDCWLALNAGLLPLAASLRRPFFGYLIGNDFLNPWIGRRSCWAERIGAMRGCWRLLPTLRRIDRRRQIHGGTRAARGLFALSSAVASVARSRFADSEHKLRVVPPGVADRFFQDRDTSAGDDLRLLTVSRLMRGNSRKNVDGVLKAIVQLPRHIRVRYRIVGDGDDRLRLEAIARDLGLQHRVTFLGKVSDDRLLAEYRQTDLFVLAARADERDVEGFGLVYLESSAGGVPVLGSRDGGAIDAIVDGWNGLLAADSSPLSIAQSIEEFQRRAMEFPASRVRGFAERFRWPRIAAELIEVMMTSIIDEEGRVIAARTVSAP
jgi:glycosyltransferase involved in cell wall biosynthesis